MINRKIIRGIFGAKITICTFAVAIFSTSVPTVAHACVSAENNGQVRWLVNRCPYSAAVSWCQGKACEVPKPNRGLGQGRRMTVPLRGHIRWTYCKKVEFERSGGKICVK